MAAVRNPFLDLPAAQSTSVPAVSSAEVNPFDTLPVAKQTKESLSPKSLDFWKYVLKLTASDLVSPLKKGLDLTRDVGVGFGKTAQNIATTLGAPPTNPVNFEELIGPKNPTFVDKTVQGLSADAPLMAAPPLRLAKYLPEGANIAKGLLNYGTDIGQNAGLLAGWNALQGKSATEGAIAGGGTTAIMNPLMQSFMSGNPLVRLGGAATLGGLGTMAAQGVTGTDNKYADLAGAAIAGGLGLRGRNATDLATMNLLKNVDMRISAPKLQAAERIGLTYLRPSEAMDSGFQGGVEGSVGVTPKAALFLENQAKARKASEVAAINKFHDTIFETEKMSPEVRKLYRASGKSTVTPEFLANLTKSSVVTDAINRVNNNSAYRDALVGVPVNSFAYLDLVKRAMNDMADEAGHGTYEASLINKQIQNLLKRMDTINPIYKQARNLAERQITRRNLENSINESQLKGRTYFTKDLMNDQKFDDLLLNLRNVPDAQKQAKDFRDVFSVLIDSDKTPRSGAKLAETGMSFARSSGQWWDRFLQKLQGGHYDMAMAKLMTDPQWKTKVAKAKAMAQPNEKARYIANMVSRASGDQAISFLEQ